MTLHVDDDEMEEVEEDEDDATGGRRNGRLEGQVRQLSKVVPHVAQSGWHGKQVRPIVDAGRVELVDAEVERKKPVGQVGPLMQFPPSDSCVDAEQVRQYPGVIEQEEQDGSQAETRKEYVRSRNDARLAVEGRATHERRRYRQQRIRLDMTQDSFR